LKLQGYAIIVALPVWIIPPRVPTPYFLECTLLGRLA
jgi:hypothetical protein